MNWDIAGHKKQIEFLEQAINKNQIAHAFIFAGPDKSDQLAVARKFGQILLCQTVEGCGVCAQCKSYVAAINADFIEINGESGIKIESIRDLSYKLALKPYMAKYKVALIDTAENMTVEASNALLKLLEEPKLYTVIILITTNPSKLLRTITSRAQKINFGPSDVKKNIQVRNQEPEELQKQYGIFLGEDLVEKLKIAYEIAEQETSEIKTILDYWLDDLRQRLFESPNRSVSHKINQIIYTRRLLEQNANTKLALTNLMLG